MENNVFYKESICFYLLFYISPTILWQLLGFSSAKPWLSINPDDKDQNVATEMELPNSHLKVYQQLTKLRESDSILYGETSFHVNGSFFGYSRVKKGNPGYLVVVNFGDEKLTQDVTKMDLMPGRGTVQIRGSANNQTE